MKQSGWRHAHAFVVATIIFATSSVIVLRHISKSGVSELRIAAHVASVCATADVNELARRASASELAGCGVNLTAGLEVGVGGRVGVRVAGAPSCIAVDAPWCADLPTAITEHGGRSSWDAPFRIHGCNLRWYSRQVACDLLQSSGHVIMWGDSLTRQLVQGLLIVLTGNATRGGMTDRAPKICRCDDQFNDAAGNKTCRDHSASYVVGTAMPCSSWKAPHLLFHSQGVGFPASSLKRYFDEPTFAGQRVVYYVSAGAHHLASGMRPTEVIHSTHEPMFAMLSNRSKDAFANMSSAPNVFPRDIMLVGTTTPPGPSKPVMYRNRLGMTAMSAHADACRKFVKETRLRATTGNTNVPSPMVAVFDSFVVMSNISSYDGTHFGEAANVVAAQVFLNVLAWSLSNA